MNLDIAQEVAALERMTAKQLQERYAELFDERSRSGNRIWLIKRITWRMQANTYGDLSERARQRAAELANDADIRMKAPPTLPHPSATSARKQPTHFKSDKARLPIPGTLLTRTYKGRDIRVKVLADGFEFEGTRFQSLSAVAREVTGSHWNGYHFFGSRVGRGNSYASEQKQSPDRA